MLHLTLPKSTAKTANQSNTSCPSRFLSITLHTENNTSYAQSMQSAPQRQPKTIERPKRIQLGPFLSQRIPAVRLGNPPQCFSISYCFPSHCLFPLVSFPSLLNGSSVKRLPSNRVCFFRSVRWYLEFRSVLSILSTVPLITSIGLPNTRMTRGFLTLISTLPSRSFSVPMWKAKATCPRCFPFSLTVPTLLLWMIRTWCGRFLPLSGLIRQSRSLSRIRSLFRRVDSIQTRRLREDACC